MRVYRLTTILPAMPLAEAIETTRIHRVAGHPTLVTNWPDRGSLCSSIAMRTGNGSYDSAIRGGRMTIARASMSITLPARLMPVGGYESLPISVVRATLHA